MASAATGGRSVCSGRGGRRPFVHGTTGQRRSWRSSAAATWDRRSRASRAMRWSISSMAARWVSRSIWRRRRTRRSRPDWRRTRIIRWLRSRLRDPEVDGMCTAGLPRGRVCDAGSPGGSDVPIMARGCDAEPRHAASCLAACTSARPPARPPVLTSAAPTSRRTRCVHLASNRRRIAAKWAGGVRAEVVEVGRGGGTRRRHEPARGMGPLPHLGRIATVPGGSADRRRAMAPALADPGGGER